MTDDPSTCLACPSISGAARISPGRPIYNGLYWDVEHAYPTCHPGWLVLVLRRHCIALHELTPAEFTELGQLQARATQLLHEVLDSQKEYLLCLGEKPGFQHIHMHVVPRPAGLPAEYTGTRIFAYLNPDLSPPLPPEEVQALCETFRSRW